MTNDIDFCFLFKYIKYQFKLLIDWSSLHDDNTLFRLFINHISVILIIDSLSKTLLATVFWLTACENYNFLAP